MKRSLLILSLFLVSLTLQAAFPHFPIASCRLELPLILFFYLCFTASLIEGGMWVLFFGLSLEAWSSPLGGLMTLSYMLVFFAVKLLEGRLFLEGVLMRGAWISLLFLLQKGLVTLFLHRGLFSLSWSIALGQALLHGVVFAGLLSLVSKCEARFCRSS